MSRRSKEHSHGNPANKKWATCFVCDRAVPKRKTKLMGKHGRACKKCLKAVRLDGPEEELTRAQELEYGGAADKNKSVAHCLLSGEIRKDDEDERRREHKKHKDVLAEENLLVARELQTYAMLGAMLAEDMKAIKEARPK